MNFRLPPPSNRGYLLIILITIFYSFMFYTLQITIQQKCDGRYLKSYKHFMEAFKSFQAKCHSDNTCELKRLNCTYNTINNRVYLIFINSDYRILKTIKNDVMNLINISQNQYNETLNSKCVFGKIVNSHYVGEGSESQEI